MNQMPYPGPTTLFHVRISGLFFLLWITNIVMLAFAAESIITNGVGVIILFASEVSGINPVITMQTYAIQYSILLASLINSKAKYILSTIEFHRAASRGGENAPAWEDKSMYIFYVDLVTGVFGCSFVVDTIQLVPKIFSSCPLILDSLRLSLHSTASR
jgi:E3 ubiquitin-protein ligase synoviolin